jgi:hypothetical protein
MSEGKARSGDSVQIVASFDCRITLRMFLPSNRNIPIKSKARKNCNYDQTKNCSIAEDHGGLLEPLAGGVHPAVPVFKLPHRLRRAVNAVPFEIHVHQPADRKSGMFIRDSPAYVASNGPKIPPVCEVAVVA